MTTHSQHSDAYSDNFPGERAGDGWITFAMVMLAFLGFANVLDGIVALTRSKFYVEDAVFVFSDLRTWAWIVLALGALQLLAAAALGAGRQWARWFAIAVAAINALGQLAFVPAYPFWALSLFAVDIFVIYALCMYGGRRA